MSDQGTTAASSPVPIESGPQSSGPSIGSRIMNGLGAVGRYIGTMNSSTALGAANLGYGIVRDLVSWRREDTAYRRAVHDMDKAGLNTFNAGQVSPAGSSPSSALQSYATYKQLEQRDRELDIQAKEVDTRIKMMEKGELAKIFGTDGAEKIVSFLMSFVDRKDKDPTGAPSRADESINNVLGRTEEERQEKLEQFKKDNPHFDQIYNSDGTLKKTPSQGRFSSASRVAQDAIELVNRGLKSHMDRVEEGALGPQAILQDKELSDSDKMLLLDYYYFS